MLLLPEACPRVYRARQPLSSPLFQLVVAVYEKVKGTWEERFEGRYGFWHPHIHALASRGG